MGSKTSPHQVHFKYLKKNPKFRQPTHGINDAVVVGTVQKINSTQKQIFNGPDTGIKVC